MATHRTRHRRGVRRVGTVVATLVLLAGCASGDDDGTTAPGPGTSTTAVDRPSTTSSPPTTVPAPSTVPTTTAPAPTTTAPVPPSTTVPPQPPDVLEPGDAGPAVAALQGRLQELRFWVGTIDGVYGDLTEQAVRALQKAAGLGIDGIVGPATWGALDGGVTVEPRSTQGLVWEVDKARQLLLLARDGALEWIFHTSTGTEQPYTYRGRTLLADTPPGRHEIEWHVDGWRDGALGRLYRPKYFHPDGIAIHGYHSVPSVPASHGCVRVTVEAMDFIWREDLAPLGTTVWVYGATPAV